MKKIEDEAFPIKFLEISAYLIDQCRKCVHIIAERFELLEVNVIPSKGSGRNVK